MNILIVTQTFPFHTRDSKAYFMYDFARSFASLGHRVTVLIPFHPELRPRSFKKIKVIPFKYIWPDRFHYMGYGRSLINDQKLKLSAYLLAPFYTFFCLIALARVIQREKIDIINAHWLLPSGFLAALLSKINHTPLFVTIPGSDAYLAQKNWFFKVISNFALKQSHQTISNSPELLDDLGIKGEVISYGVPMNPYKKMHNKVLKVATAGRLVEKKGIDILKKEYSTIEVISDFPIDLFRRKLCTVDIFVAYSIRDSQGNLDDASLTVLEAMAAGCSVITTDLGGNREIIKSDHDGLLVSNIQELKKAVQYLKRSPQLRKKFSQTARESIKRSFTPEKIAQLYLKLFSSVFSH